MQYALVDGFTGMGLVQLSLPLSTFRKVTYFLALFWLPGAFGVRAVFYAEPISDILVPWPAWRSTRCASAKFSTFQTIPPGINNAPGQAFCLPGVYLLFADQIAQGFQSFPKVPGLAVGLSRSRRKAARCAPVLRVRIAAR